jgi:hypothetical protein
MLRTFRSWIRLAAILAACSLFSNVTPVFAQDNCPCENDPSGAACRGAKGGHSGPVKNWVRGAGNGNCQPYAYGRNDLFANYYTPVTCGAMPAALYISPNSTIPQLVGHTYITNEAFMPHEFLYPHHRNYHRNYDGGRGLTRTSVHYYHPPVRTAGAAVLQTFRIAR